MNTENQRGEKETKGLCALPPILRQKPEEIYRDS